MKNGGKRPGAGRKKGYKAPQTLEKEFMREKVRQRIFAAADEMLDAQISNSKGIKYLVKREKNGKFTKLTEAQAAALLQSGEEPVEIWEERPNVQAFTDLMNRALGKPEESTLPLDVNFPQAEAILAILEAGRKRLGKRS